jgi:hypothetical protein
MHVIHLLLFKKHWQGLYIEGFAKPRLNKPLKFQFRFETSRRPGET